MKFEASTFFLQWAVGGLFFLWVTSRERVVGLGYGWTTRAVYILIATIGLVVGLTANTVWLRESSSILLLVATLVAMAISIGRRGAGVSGQKDIAQKRTLRVALMLKKAESKIF